MIGRAFGQIGAFTMAFFGRWGAAVFLLLRTLRSTLGRPFYLGNLFYQVEFIGIRSLPVVLLTSIFTGMVLALQIFSGFERFGAESMTGTVVGYSIVRELGPVLVGLMVAGRAGAAMAAELGTMRVTQQIDALYALSADPVRYLIVPRFWAGVIALPLLVVIGDFIGIWGGYVVSVGMLGANPVVYWDNTFDFMELWDVFSGLIKATAFGAIIAFVASFQGYTTSGGARGVGRATTSAVVSAATLILAANYLITYLVV
ncbi:MlaE family ABC transporter permease [Thiohalorhabdus sp.]|uniref:MlaE family ABC transporter permease n=1 Tax=Thiohalorhabdus sp. TaxID=3094134 RepID=UPI002FC296E9